MDYCDLSKFEREEKENLLNLFDRRSCYSLSTIYGLQSRGPEPSRGSPAVILRVLREGQGLLEGDIQELERVMEEGKIPINFDSPFDE